MNYFYLIKKDKLSNLFNNISTSFLSGINLNKTLAIERKKKQSN
jgi:hypothetical protein